MSDPWYPADEQEPPRAETPPGYPSAKSKDSSDVPPRAPTPPKMDTKTTMQLSSSDSSSTFHPAFAESGSSQDIYKNTTLSGFPVAGQQKNGGLVEASEFRASTILQSDGVQHKMYAGWKNHGESGVNSKDLKWFEKRAGDVEKHESGEGMEKGNSKIDDY